MSPEDQIKLVKIFKDHFKIENIHEIKNLSRDNCVKWDSLAAVSLIATISDVFSIEINPSQFETVFKP